ncbi:MAG: hypothetical protein IKN97_10070 [Lachnospiraceae bacterium]|nr:hypothetical protein [Lachnospiraceae bacterium]
MREEKWKAGRGLLRVGMTAVLALGSFFIHTPQTVYAIDNSALYGSLGDIQDVTAGQATTGAMASVNNQSVTQPAPVVTPAVQAAVAADPLLPSERTVEVYLSERYNEEYRLYEFGLNNKYFFYSNVGNGAMTSDPVRIEIPGNITYSLEKDGNPIRYNQNTDISAIGAYVMTLAVNEVDGLVTTHYVSYYRFRIMEPIQPIEQIPDETAEESNIAEETPEDIIAEIEALEDLTPEEREALQNALVNGDYTGEEFFNADGSVNEAAISLLVTASLDAQTGTTEDIYHTEGVLSSTGMESAYDYTTGYYLHTLISGQSFYSDIQNGGITRQSVTLRTADKLDFTVYKDGELLEENGSTVFTDPGSYLVVPVADDVLYISSYETEKPVFSFRIIGNAVNDLSVYRAPVGFRIDSIYMYEDGESHPVSSALSLNDTSVLLREDGDYRIRISSNAATMEVYYTLDRIHPRFNVQVEKNHAMIIYDSADVIRSIVYRGDDRYMAETGIIYEIKETGEYRYFAQDAAGNVTGRAFKVKFGFNTGSVVTILIIIAAIAGLFMYIRYINKNTRVR